MEERVINVSKSKSGSGSTSTRIVLPAKWVKELDIDKNVVAKFDGKQIVIRKAEKNEI